MNELIGLEKIKCILETTVSGYAKMEVHAKDMIAKAFKEIRYESGQVLVEENRTNDAAYLLIEGSCKVYLKNNPIGVQGSELQRPEGGNTPF